MVLAGRYDMASEFALISITRFGETLSASGVTRVGSIGLEFGDRRHDVIPLLSGGYLDIAGGVQDCTVRVAFRPSAMINLKDMLETDTYEPEGTMESVADLWAAQASLDPNSNPYTGDEHLLTVSKYPQWFRVTVLLGSHDLIINHATSGKKADEVVDTAAWGGRLTFSECTVMSSSVTFDPALGLTQSLTLRCATFDRNGMSNILIEQKLNTGTLDALGAYTTEKWSYGSYNVPERL